jgi:ABC-type multidrug transport system permease subunit
MLSKEFRQMLRDVRMRLVIFVMPVVQLTVRAWYNPNLESKYYYVPGLIAVMLLTTFLILMPAVLLSGFIFPIRNMPEPVQVLTVVNPVRWFLQILQGIAVRGVGLSDLWPAIAAQATLAAGFVSLAVIRFKKTH